MKGRKRSAASEFEQPGQFGSRRAMDGSIFNTNRAELFNAGSRPLDIARAEAAQSHVRALNSQFASWVQQQLQNHPYELWQDGVQDYLSHSSEIMAKFHDVVEWLKANAEKNEKVPNTELKKEKQLVPEPKGSANFMINNGKSVLPAIGGSTASVASSWSFGLLPNNQGSAQSVGGSTTTVANSWSFGLLPNNQASAPSGNRPSVSTDPETTGDQDDETEPQQPSSPSVKSTEEKGIIVVHETRCKVYVQSESPEDKGWKDIGVGQLFVKCKEGTAKGAKDSRPTIFVRNDVGRVVLNALLYAGIKTNTNKNTVTVILHSQGGSAVSGVQDAAKARPYLLRAQSEEAATSLASAIREYALISE